MTKPQREPQLPARGRPCLSCETGTLRRTNLRGTVLPYRDEPDLLVTHDIEVSRCDVCGEMALKASEITQLSAVLEAARVERKRGAITKFVEYVDTEFPDVPRYEWEAAFGLSKGYFSRLTTTRVMDTPLEILLTGITANPREGLHLLAITRALPPKLSHRLSEMTFR